MLLQGPWWLRFAASLLAAVITWLLVFSDQAPSAGTANDLFVQEALARLRRAAVARLNVLVFDCCVKSGTNALTWIAPEGSEE